MKDIAQKVGVSKTTVHRALTGQGRISDVTRKRIIEVAREMDYTPNTLARSLRQRRTATLGVVTQGVSNSFYAGLLASVEEAASSKGYSILFCCSMGNRELEASHLHVLREKRVDGLLVAPSHPEGLAEPYRRLQRAGLPFVFLDRTMPSVAADAVMTDHRLAGELVARHLLEQGCRRIGIICELDPQNRPTSIAERIEGLTSVAVLGGADVIPIGRPCQWDPMEDYAAFALGTFLDAGGDVDAVFGVNDHFALGAVWALRARGIRVPEDVAVAGYDDLDVSSFMHPSLTTIRQPTRQLAWDAVKILLSRMDGSSGEPACVRLRPILMERDSSRRAGAGLR